MDSWFPPSIVSVFIAILLILAMVLTTLFRKLTPPAALTAGVVGWIIFAGGGITGFLLLCAFFLMGTLATAWRREEKDKLEPHDPFPQGRTSGQVLANAGVAQLLALLVGIFPAYAHLLQMMLAASFAAATADTLASELGTVYGRRFYNCLTWKPDTKGLDGVISLEGTLIGIGGAGIIALIYGVRTGWTRDCLFIVIAGAIGNLADSILGAALERKGRMSNNRVNFLSVAIAALLAGALRLALG